MGAGLSRYDSVYAVLCRPCRAERQQQRQQRM